MQIVDSVHRSKVSKCMAPSPMIYMSSECWTDKNIEISIHRSLASVDKVHYPQTLLYIDSEYINMDHIRGSKNDYLRWAYAEFRSDASVNKVYISLFIITNFI